MDHSHVGGRMPSSYVPRKRKTVQPQQKSGVPCPVLQRMPERAYPMSVIGLGPSKNDESHAHEALKMKRTYSRKSRYEDLQTVPVGGAEYPTTSQSSCSIMSSSGLSNGVDPGSLAPPSARLPPRLLPKDCWPPGPDAGRERGPPQEQPWNPSRDARGPDQAWATGRERSQDQTWNSGRDRGHPGPDHAWIPGRDRSHLGPDQAWTTSRDRGPDQAWATGRDRGQDQAWNPGRDPGRDRAPSAPEQAWNTGRGQDQAWNSSSRDRADEQHVWRPDFQMKKVQRVELDRTAPVISFPQNQEVRESGSIPLSVGLVQSGSVPPSSASEQSVEEQKPKIFSTKKEPPVYPPGSQEERWQLQILAKGRVTCPKCKSVSRKTVEGLKKHMENCRLHPFTCQHCGKQLKSSTGMKYHIMADHSNLPSPEDANGLDDHTMKDKLRKILKRLGKLKCSKEGCTGSFTSIMGYMYHMRKCGKEESELEKMVLNCSHCGKPYKSKAGLEYHLKSEHAPQVPLPSEEEEEVKAERETNPERTASGRIKRMSAQVADFHLAEIANDELSKEWPKRKVLKDLVPDDKKLKYSRPGLPAFSQEVLRKWKNEVKLQRKVQCPNQGCNCVYTSVSGLKAHLGLCTRGDFEAGKYRCLICNKEFNSESGVKYHINSVHSQDWFVTNKKACAKFEKFLKNKPKEFVHNVDQQIIDQYHQHHLHHQQNLHHQHHHHHHHHQHQLHHHHQPHLHHDPQHHLHHHHHHQPPPPPPPAHLHLPAHPAQQQPPPPLLDQQLLLPQLPPPHPEQHQPVLHYTPLEPWVDVARRVIQGGPDLGGPPVAVEMVPMDKPVVGDRMGGGKRKEKGGKRKGNGKRKESFATFGGTSSSSGTSSSESEAEEHGEGQRQFDQWSLKRPGIMEANSEVAKRPRNNT